MEVTRSGGIICGRGTRGGAARAHRAGIVAFDFQGRSNRIRPRLPTLRSGQEWEAMKITRIGAAGGEVTGSAYLVDTASDNVLVDCGFFQGTR
jgi:hypothetical protein